MRPWILVAVPLLAGCTSFEDRPLDPAQSAAAFRARSLDDPDLLAFLREALHPAPATPPRTWGLDELTAVALFAQPDLELARARLGVVQAGEVTAGARQRPSAALDAEHSADPPDGDSPWVLGLTLQFPIEVGGKRSLRLDEARHLSAAARFDLGAAVWATRAHVRDALVAHLLDQREVEQWRAEAELLGQRTVLLQQRLSAGAVSQPDVDEALVEQAEAQQALPAAEGRAAGSLATLAAAVGLPTSALVHADIAWPALDAPPPAVALTADALHDAGLLNRVDVRAALARYDAAQSALQLEVARQYPDVTLGPGYLFDQGQHKITFGVSGDLPWFDGNAGPIAEAEARRTEARAEVLALQATVLAQTDSALARYAAARASLDAADRSANLLRQREESTRRSIQLGGDDALALSGARQTRLAAERSRLDALREVHEALGGLEDALQRPVTGPAGPGTAAAP